MLFDDVGAAHDLQRAKVQKRCFQVWCGHFEINPRALRGIVHDRYAADIAFVRGNHPGEAVQNAGPGVGVDQQPVILNVHIAL